MATWGANISARDAAGRSASVVSACSHRFMSSTVEYKAPAAYGTDGSKGSAGVAEYPSGYPIATPFELWL